MRKLTGLLSVLLVLVFAGALVGDVVHSQPVQESPWGVNSDIAAPQTMWADNFTLSEDCMITDVHWWGYYEGDVLPEGPPQYLGDYFTVDFYDGAMPMPNPAPLHRESAGNSVNRVPAGFLAASGETVYYYEYFLQTPIQLLEGEQYYLSIYNSTWEENWFWAEGTGGDGRLWSRPYDWDPWQTNPGMFPLAFELTGYPTGGPTIPEPITSLLFGGSVLFGLAKLRRKQS